MADSKLRKLLFGIFCYNVGDDKLARMYYYCFRVRTTRKYVCFYNTKVMTLIMCVKLLYISNRIY